MPVDQSTTAVGVVLALLGSGVEAVGVAVDEGHRPEAIDTLLSVVGQDGLGAGRLGS